MSDNGPMVRVLAAKSFAQLRIGCWQNYRQTNFIWDNVK